MNAVAELTSFLIERGMEPADAAALVARAGAEMATPGRSKGAIRTARWRENRASQNVTNVTPVTVHKTEPEASPSVTDRHKPSQRDGAHIYTLPSKDLEKEERKREGRPKKQASQLPDDWRPSEHDIEAAVRKGLAPERIPAVAEKFKNHWLAKAGRNTSTNWHLNWCTWVMNELEWNGSANGKRGDSVSAAIDRLIARAEGGSREDAPDDYDLGLLRPAGR